MGLPWLRHTIATLRAYMLASFGGNFHHPAMLAQEQLIPADRERHRVVTWRRARCDAGNAGHSSVGAFPAEVRIVLEVLARYRASAQREGLRGDEWRVLGWRGQELRHALAGNQRGGKCVWRGEAGGAREADDQDGHIIAGQIG